MAQFSVLRGDSSRIDTSSTPFKDGRAYFTPDDGHLYIDSYVDGIPRRIPVSPSYRVVYGTLYANAWQSSSQKVAIANLKANQNGIIGVPQNITNEQLIACNNAELFVSKQEDGFLTISLKGRIPTYNIPFVIIQFD